VVLSYLLLDIVLNKFLTAEVPMELGNTNEWVVSANANAPPK
jgi:hypothetical protein